MNITSEYIKREVLLEKAKELASGSFSTPLIISAIENAPKADVVEVVRCKDCEYFRSIDYNLHKCEEHSDGWGDHTVYVGKDDYCSFGIRKEGAEE